MKILILSIIMTLSLFSATEIYPSLHQLSNESLLEQLKKSGTARGAANIYIYGQVERDQNQRQCVDNTTRFRVYIPGGVAGAAITITTKKNTNIVAYATYRADKENLIDIDNTTDDLSKVYLDQQSYKTFGDTTVTVVFGDGRDWRDNKTGGWLYVDVAGYTNIVPSSFFNNISVTAYVQYDLYFPSDLTDYNYWLNNTYFKENGDPVEDSGLINVRRNSCDYYDIREFNLYPDLTGASKIDGTDYIPDGYSEEEICESKGDYWNGTTCIKAEEKNCIDANGEWLDTYCKTVEMQDCELDSGEWSLTEQRCQSESELDCDKVDSQKWNLESNQCLSTLDIPLTQINAEDNITIDNILANKEGWFTNIILKSLNTNETLSTTGKVKIYTDGVTAPVFEKSFELNNEETLNFDLFQNNAKVYLESNEGDGSIDEKSLNFKSGGLLLDSLNIASSNYLITATVKYIEGGKIVPVSNEELAYEMLECENKDGTWNDELETCILPIEPSSSSSSSSSISISSSSSSVSSDMSPDETECRDAGGIWYDDGICDYPSTSYDESTDGSSYTGGGGSTTVSSSSSSVDSQLVEINTAINTVANRSHEVQGYFFYFDTNRDNIYDPYDWFYITTNMNLLVKLSGMNKTNGNLIWTQIDYKRDVFNSITLSADKQYIKVSGIEETDILPGISNYVNALANYDIKIKGYFINYDVDNNPDTQNAYHWIYTSTDFSVVAKLKGINDSTGNLEWSMLDNAFYSISVNDNIDQLIFGSKK